MVKGSKQLIDRGRPEGVADLRPVEGDPNGAVPDRPVVGDVGEVEPGNGLPRVGVEDL